MEYHLQAVDQLTFTDGLDHEDGDEGKNKVQYFLLYIYYSLLY